MAKTFFIIFFGLTHLICIGQNRCIDLSLNVDFKKLSKDQINMDTIFITKSVSLYDTERIMSKQIAFFICYSKNNNPQIVNVFDQSMKNVFNYQSVESNTYLNKKQSEWTTFPYLKEYGIVKINEIYFGCKGKWKNGKFRPDSGRVVFIAAKVKKE